LFVLLVLQKMPTTDFLNELTNFFSAAIHLILYTRRVYPVETFERRRLFDVAVYRSRHPELAEYIALTMRGLREMLERREAHALVILILGPGGTTGVEVYERFVFELHAVDQSSFATDADISALRNQLRGFLVKLHVCDSMLTPTKSEGLSFSLELHSTSTSSGDRLSDEMRGQWVECDLEEEVGVLCGDSSIVPLKSCSEPPLRMQLLVQEAARKGDLFSQRSVSSPTA